MSGMNPSTAPTTSRLATAALLLAALAAAIVPLVHRSNGAAAAAGKTFPGWPAHYDGRPLAELPLTPREQAFLRDFPGRVGRFSDGRREIIIRFIGAATRKLHPAADCLRGIGYRVTPTVPGKDADGATMACFRASRGEETFNICELIRDQHGASWPHVSAWYWSGMLGQSAPPWWSFVVAERE
jgi:hypothetical protein